MKTALKASERSNGQSISSVEAVTIRASIREASEAVRQSIRISNSRDSGKVTIRNSDLSKRIVR
jgi:hypothetical protein